MRQTSRAVALLLALESANAVASITAQNPNTVDLGGAYDTAFNPANNEIGNPSLSNQLNNRQAGYKGTWKVFSPSSAITSGGWTAATYRTAKIDNSSSAITSLDASTTNVKGSMCVQCIRGAGVWCSRTFSYLSTDATIQAETTTNVNVFLDADSKLVTGASADQGSCCDTAVNFNLFIGTKAAPVRTNKVWDNTDSKNGALMVQPACVAMFNADYTKAATANNHSFQISQIDNRTDARSSWWCSNGLYKKVFTAGTAAVMNSQQTIFSTQNKRLELALVGCPQTKSMCGYDFNGKTAVTTPVVATELTANAPSWTVVIPTGDTNGMSTLAKCTWVVHSTISAPTWTMSNDGYDATVVNGKAVGYNASGKGLVGSNWQLHAMEYTANTATLIAGQSSAPEGSLQIATGGGLVGKLDSLAPTNMTPLFTMPGKDFATLRTWYGEGSMTIDPITQQPGTWNSPGQAPIAVTKEVSAQLAQVKSQLYGNVVNVPVSNWIDGPSNTNPIGNFNVGTYNGSNVFDLRQIRYLPAQVAQTSHAAGTTAQGKYTAALSAYKTAQTTWDNYVAILEKNSSQDAFAALFSPPKAPTVPPLPNKPWVPAAYSGYTRATPQQVVSFTANAALAKQAATPLATEIWTNRSAAETLGGWGTFTASIFTFRNGWGKSFGTIGYSGDADSLNMSDVWNYKWTCSTATGTVVGGVAPASTLTNTQCAPTYTGTNGDLFKPTAATPVNAVKMVSVVSLWSTAEIGKITTDTPSKWAQNGLVIKFTGSAWKSGIVGLTAITLPTGASDAKSLTGLAGAQALVASSAAALAVAAALY